MNCSIHAHAFWLMLSQVPAGLVSQITQWWSVYGRYVAKRFGQSSVLGSYLDPLADKVLIGSVVAALGYQVGSPLTLACHQPASFKTSFTFHHR